MEDNQLEPQLCNNVTNLQPVIPLSVPFKTKIVTTGLSGVAYPGLKRGPKPKKTRKRVTEFILEKNAPEAAKYLAEVAKDKAKGQRERIDAAKFIVNQVVGAPVAKTMSQEDIVITIRQAPPPVIEEG